MSNVERRCPWRANFWASAFNFDLLSDFLDLRRHSVSLRAVRGDDIVERKQGLSTREFAFTYQSGPMQRFMAFNSAAEWRRAVLKATPLKMDFGAVYSDCVSKIQERKDTLSAVKAICVIDRKEFAEKNYDAFTGKHLYTLLAERGGVTEYTREQYGHCDVESLLNDSSLCDGITSLAADEMLVEKAFESMHNRLYLSELCGDIDLPDYQYPGHRDLLDAENNVVAAYWLLLCVSIECTDRWLRDTLGLQNVLWVLSGGKGAHFVCGDAIAMGWSTAARTALVSYFNADVADIAKTTYTEKLYKQRLEHPHLAMIDAVIKPRFAELVEQLGCVRAEFLKPDDAKLPFAQHLIAGKDAAAEAADLFLFALREGPVKERMRTVLVSMINPGLSARPLVKDVLDELERAAGVGNTHYLVALRCHIAAPQLDANVTKQANHLLKMPLVPHHSTNKIAVPFKVSKWDSKARAWSYDPLYEFDRTSVLSLAAVLDEFKSTTPEKYEAMRGKRATLLGPFEAVMVAYLRKRNVGLQEMGSVPSMEF